MTEHGDVSKGTTQIGKVKRPLAAVSNMTKRGQKMVLFCEDNDWAIDRRDPVASQILELIDKVKSKTRIHEHKGTYRMRAWLIPEGAKEAPFGRQEA